MKKDLEVYINKTIEGRPAEAKLIHPGTVVTAPWVGMKCRYKAFVFLAGPCNLCKECGKIKGTACLFGSKARPSMEACGMDVYQTARNNGFPIHPLRDKTETQNDYCLLLVD